MKDARLVFAENVVPLVAPVDSAGTAYASPYLSLKNALHATIFAYFGVVTATSADQAVIVSLQASTAAASNATEVACAFNYRLSGATGANTWGAVTAATATGATIATTDDGKLLAIDVDPAAIVAAHGQVDCLFVRVLVGIDAGGTVTLNALWAVLDPMYPQATHLSAT